MKRKIAYPDDWSDYSCEDLHLRLLSEGGSYWEAVRELRKYQNRKTAEKLTKPINKDLWDSNPMIVNCEYDPAVNGINVYAGYIKGMYRPDMSDEELYAEIGVSIGHEISHAFDDRGSQFDADGNLADWWDPEDFRVFTEKNAKLAAYYDGMQPWDGEHYHSEIMTGEALADMTGMKVILRLAAKNPDFDYDKFFKSYAGLWLTKESVEITKARLMDEHPLRCLRINCTLQQYDEFLNFYDIKEGDGMYLAPEERVNIW
jgi:putative endopeptidase